MFLATSAIATATATAAAAAAFTCIMSPSRNKCIRRVNPSCFRYEPYGACVLPLSELISEAPIAAAVAALSESPVAHVPVEPLVPTTPSAAVAAAVAATAAAAKKPTVRYAVIRFKHETMTFVAPFRIAVGDLVVVDGDRGEDIGVVAEISKSAPSFAVERKVIRRATDADRETLKVQRAREVEAMKATETLAQSLGLQARIEDAEYQFDFNKLTIFVRRASKNGFVDFRKLQRGLFRQFRCRIWCAYMDEVEAAEAGPRTK